MRRAPTDRSKGEKTAPAGRVKATPLEGHPAHAAAEGHRTLAEAWLLLGLIALLVFRPLLPSEPGHQPGDGLWTVVGFLALSVIWAMGSLEGKRIYLRFGWVDAALLSFVGFHSVAAMVAVGRASPRPALNVMWEWIGVATLFFLVRQLTPRGRPGRAVAVAMVSLAAGLAAYGLYQVLWELPATQAAYAANPDAALAEAGVHLPPDSPERQLFESRLRNREPLATFALTNSLAGFLVVWLVFLVGTWGRDPACRPPAWRRWLSFLPPVLVATCLLWTKSRSGCLAALVGFGLVGLRQSGLPRLPLGKRILPPAAFWALLAILLPLVAGIGLAAFAPGLARAATSLRYRFEYWQATLAMIADSPWFGCGPGNFQNVYTRFKLPGASEEVADPHNCLLEVWSTAGTPAAIVFLLVLGLALFALFRPARAPAPAEPASDDNLPGDDRVVRYLPGALVAGFVLAVPLSAVCGFPISRALLLLSLPVALGTAWVLRHWIEGGAMTGWMCAVPAVALLVHLSASGGIGFPGVAYSLWVLLALGLNASPQSASLHYFSRPGGVLLLGLVAALALTGYFVGHLPVFRAQSALRMGLATQNPRQFEAAARFDPLDPRPHLQLASLALSDWAQHGGDDARQRFEEETARAIALEPNSAPTAAWVGIQYLEAYRKFRRESLVREATAALRRAVDLYPTSAAYHGQHALALRAAGSENAAREEARLALELDAGTSHLDQKLDAPLRKNMVDLRDEATRREGVNVQ